MSKTTKTTASAAKPATPSHEFFVCLGGDPTTDPNLSRPVIHVFKTKPGPLTVREDKISDSLHELITQEAAKHRLMSTYEFWAFATVRQVVLDSHRKVAALYENGEEGYELITH